MTDVAPVQVEEARSLIAAALPSWYQPGEMLAVGCSGGPDSLALTLLAADAFPGRVHALIVDHGLRAGSAVEAGQTQAWLTAQNIPSDILVRTGEKPMSGIQAAARAARYRLLGAGCDRLGTGILLLAHHLDDQAETFLMAIGRGAGVNGLAGMAACRNEGEINIVRPLLAIPKARLIATLEARGQAWIDDPGNANRRFDRVRLRQQMAALADAGVTPVLLAGAAVRLADARDLMADLRREIWRQVTGERGKHARLRLSALHPLIGSLPGQRLVLVPVLADMIELVSGATPRFEELYRVIIWVAGGGEGPAHPASRTLGRCRIAVTETELVVGPE
jgi:tRNA(Ile)-lysidine synthase